MIGSTLQLSLNRAKVSFLPCGTNEKFINLCRIAGPGSYFNCRNLPAMNKTGKRWGMLTMFSREILCFNSTTRNKWIKAVIRELEAMKNPTHVLQRDLLFQGNHGLTLCLCFQLHGWQWEKNRESLFPCRISHSNRWSVPKHRLSQHKGFHSAIILEKNFQYASH